RGELDQRTRPNVHRLRPAVYAAENGREHVQQSTSLEARPRDLPQHRLRQARSQHDLLDVEPVQNPCEPRELTQSGRIEIIIRSDVPDAVLVDVPLVPELLDRLRHFSEITDHDRASQPDPSYVRLAYDLIGHAPAHVERA